MTFPNSINGSIQNGNGFNCYSVSLTSAQVKALVGTPIVVIPAVGAGIGVVPIRGICKLTYGGNNAFTNVQNLTLVYTGTTTTFGNFNSNVFSATANTYGYLNPLATGIVANTSVENNSMSIVNLATDLTGNAANDNTVTINIYYATFKL